MEASALSCLLSVASVFSVVNAIDDGYRIGFRRGGEIWPSVSQLRDQQFR